MLKFVFCIVILCTFSVQKTSAWSYHDIGGWYVTNPVCGSASQSPINFLSDTVQYNTSASSIIFNNYDSVMDSVDFDITNNGHTVVIGLTYRSQQPIGISGADLPGNYSLYQFHFHWGSTNVRGSEHTVDRAQYPAELHLVHYNPVYNSSNLAANASDGLAVLGVFVQIGPNDNPAFNSILNYFQSISYENQMVSNLSHFAVRSLLPSNTNDYYRYKGSLTTPPCYNSVTWTVFREPVLISLRQLNEFRDLHESLKSDDHEEPLVDNFRTVQPLNGRTVYSSFDSTKIDWNYTDPSNWDVLYPSCGGKNQSPINIVSSLTDLRNDFGALVFSGYSQPQNVTLINTGYSVDIMISSQLASISGGGLSGKYNLYQVSLRWGQLNTSGAEHSIDSIKYPLEIQLLHYKDQYGSSSKASNYPQGIAILSSFVKMSGTANLSFLNASTLQSLQYSGSSLINGNFILQTLLPADTSNFYRYNGSLTVPRCLETVVWTVFTDTLYISPAQLNALQNQVYGTAYGAVPAILSGSIGRPLQDLNNRTVFRVKTGPATTTTTTSPRQAQTTLRNVGARTHQEASVVFQLVACVVYLSIFMFI